VSKTIFRIENGVLALELVDTAAVGYDPAWQAPDGAVLPDVDAADYDTAADGFQCQVVTGVLQSSPQSTTENLDGTWCDLPEVVTITGEDTFAVALDVYQDPNTVGLSAYLYEHRGAKAYAYFGMGPAAGSPPVAVGVVTLASVSIGGGRQAARAQVTFPFDRAPDVQFGTTAEWRVVFGDRATPPVDGPPAPLEAEEADTEGAELEAAEA
jgi:hypothetical protein